MNETKQFGVRTLLTVTTHRLVTESDGPRDNGIGKLYNILSWMVSDDVFTHQIPRVNKECEPWLLRWFPELEQCGTEAALNRLDVLLAKVCGDEAISQWVSEFADLKKTYDVPKIPMDDHDRKHPLTELAEMVDPAKIHVVEIERDQ